MQVALLGGSFNPPHVGHLLAAVYVRAVASVDAVWLLPVHRHPFAKELAPFDDRVAMCEALCNGVEGLSVSRAEAEREGPGYTLLTVRHLQARHPGVRFRLVVGTDLVGELPRWHGAGELMREASPIVVGRSGHALTPEQRAWAEEHGLELRCEVQLPEVSSTEVRRRLSAGEPVNGLLSGPVLQMLRQKNIYRKDTPRSGD